MNRRSKRRGLAVAALGMCLGAGVGGAAAQNGPARPPAHGNPKTAQEAYKNIQVLKDAPADQLLPAMQFIAASLGVECEHCHVGRTYEKDDKKPKQTARKMMQMMMAINKDNFDSHREVTCYTCHHGTADPVGTPILTDEEPKPEAEEANASGAKPTALPAPDQILEKYAQAIGGAEDLQRISSRLENGTITAFGGHFPIEVFAKAPDKRFSMMHTPNGDSITAYDGHVGWMGNTGRPPREMSPAETEAFKLDADFYFPVHVKQVFTEFRVRPLEKVANHEAYQVVALRQGRPPVRLYFDEQSGLLLRLVRYAETPLGRLPTQIDYADYRDADGVKVPFRWTLTRPDGRFTIQVDRIQQNVGIDDGKFMEPTKPVSGGKPHNGSDK